MWGIRRCEYRQISNIDYTLVGNKLVDHSDYIFIFDLTSVLNRLGKGNCKTKGKSFKFCDLGRLISGILQYV